MLFISIWLSSCNQETVYSCDASADAWVHDNLAEIQVMTRSEWNNLEEGLKIPAYRAFTLQQRVNFWNEKLTDVLALGWSDEESEHLNLLIQFINEHQHFLDGYDNMTDEEKNIFDLFFYQWTNKAKEDFQWSDRLLRSIIASGNTLLNKKGKLLVNRGNGRKAILLSTESTCNCSMASDWCTPSGWDCEEVPCEETSWGCGTILVYDCDGRCAGI